MLPWSLGDLGEVPLHMQRKVVGSREGPLADRTLERLGSGVFPVVTCQLVRSGESPLALRPVALVRLLSCNNKPSENFQPKQRRVWVTLPLQMPRRGKGEKVLW